MKKNILTVIFGFIAIVLIILGVFLLSGNKKKDNKLKPYVEEHGIKVLSAKKDITIPFIPYAKDSNKNPVIPEGVTFEDTNGTYKFYDYNVGETDDKGYVTYSFKYDLVVPITYTVDTSKNTLNNGWSRSYAFLQANVFDYYTGELYKEKNETISGKVAYHNISNPTEEEMQFTNITWDNKTYKIGVRNEVSSSWDGNRKVNTNDQMETYKDTSRITVAVYVYAPKDYDGLMVTLNKKGTSKDLILKQMEINNKYNELLNAANSTGEKSKELVELEKKLNAVYKLLDTNYNGIKNTKDDFYVIKVNDITKSK